MPIYQTEVRHLRSAEWKSQDKDIQEIKFNADNDMDAKQIALQLSALPSQPPAQWEQVHECSTFRLYHLYFYHLGIYIQLRLYFEKNYFRNYAKPVTIENFTKPFTRQNLRRQYEKI